MVASKIDQYFRKLAELDMRDADPNGMPLFEELARLRQLEDFWESMTAEEQRSCLVRLKKRDMNASS